MLFSHMNIKVVAHRVDIPLSPLSFYVPRESDRYDNPVVAPDRYKPHIDVLTTLIDNFRRHLLIEGSRTLDVYLGVLQQVYDEFPQAARRASCPPSADQVQDHIRTHFPRVIIESGVSGCADYGSFTCVPPDCPDAIVLWDRHAQAIIDSVANVTSTMSDWMLQHLLLACVANDLTHHLLRHYYGIAVPPLGGGPRDGNHGEYGYLAEKMIFGGVLSVVFDQKDMWYLSKIRRLWFEMPDGQAFFIEREHVNRLVVQSLVTAEIHKIDPLDFDLQAAHAEPGTVRFRGPGHHPIDDCVLELPLAYEQPGTVVIRVPGENTPELEARGIRV